MGDRITGNEATSNRDQEQLRMMIGNPAVFAIDSNITEAYSSRGMVGLGYFTIIVQNRRYGVHRPDATLLACSLDEVESRLKNRGTHNVPAFDVWSAHEIAQTYRERVYFDHPSQDEPDSISATLDAACRNNVVWAPDGDAAFDDSSYVLQFDIGNLVRLIAFTAAAGGFYDEDKLREIRLPADEFYALLHQWQTAFLAEWTALSTSN